MKIVLAYNYDPSHLRTGGGITYVHNLVQGLLERGDEVTLLGVSLGPVRFRHPRFHFIPVLQGADGFFRFVAALRICLRSATLPQEAVIHAHHPLVLDCFLPRFRRSPLVCTFHGVTLDWVDVNHAWMSAMARLLYIPRESRILRQATVLTTAGPAPRAGLAKRHPILFAQKPVHVTPSGIDLGRFRPRPKAALRRKHGLEPEVETIVYAGRFSGQKDLPLLLSGVRRLQQERPGVRLVMVGRGPEGAAMRRLAAELGLQGTVFKGEVPPEHVPEVLSCADVVALTSAYEASPTIVKEALACGVPVVTTDTGDVRSNVPAGVGLVVGRRPEEVAAGLAQVLDDMAARSDAIRDACRALAEARFGFGAICDQFRAIYVEAAGLAASAGRGGPR